MVANRKIIQVDFNQFYQLGSSGNVLPRKDPYPRVAIHGPLLRFTVWQARVVHESGDVTLLSSVDYSPGLKK